MSGFISIKIEFFFEIKPTALSRLNCRVAVFGTRTSEFISESEITLGNEFPNYFEPDISILTKYYLRRSYFERFIRKIRFVKFQAVSALSNHLTK